MGHPLMSIPQWQQIYYRAWHLYYSWEHIETLLRRAAAGAGTRHVAHAILCYYGSFRFEHVHPMQCGLVRNKRRDDRRPGLPREGFLSFHLGNLREFVTKYPALGLFSLKLERLRKRIQRDPRTADYTDLALTPLDDAGPMAGSPASPQRAA